ncbi:LacI family DNA-binding transcriptional regulator [Pseudomonas atacamensis]|uniref:LacI family DNA-binding transcriptional regulator n=1 Tax=Pseudomonas atacamensis TaxID=2565368 RepID=UPI00244B1500|nr:LacI family DNA-binding transcriptional regulator [Pseudomonas atacamensis]MDH2076878.1 LacI family DNA-binding transcriptional regulator [Pseudomonas atacamensis]
MGKPSKRQGLSHVAELAGVSLSTVERVLNDRGVVSELKRRKVLTAARALGIRRALPVSFAGPMIVDVLLADSATDHFKRLDAALDRQAQRLGAHLTLRRQTWSERNPQQLLDALRKPRSRRHGMIVVAPDRPDVHEALSLIVQRGIPTVLLTSNLTDVQGTVYIGIDNHAAGRSAGRLMSQWVGQRPGAVLLVVNSLAYFAHQERAKGFIDVMSLRAPDTPVVGPLECFDDEALTQAAVSSALAQHAVAGIYDTGSGTPGIHAALAQAQATPVWIGHEASALHADLLRAGVMSLVLDQDPEGQVQASIDYLLHQQGVIDSPPQLPLAMKIVIDENL